MPSFKATFELAELSVRSMIEEHGFNLLELSVTDNHGSQMIGGAAHYVENSSTAPAEKRYIHLSTAPLRLELDLYIGVGDYFYTIQELNELAGNTEFPERKHDLYKAAYDQDQLKAEFKTLIGVLMECGSRFFSNDPSLWSDLDGQRDRWNQEMENRLAPKTTEEAFKNQEWEMVVEILEQQHKFLSKLDLGRLRYAKKKI